MKPLKKQGTLGGSYTKQVPEVQKKLEAKLTAQFGDTLQQAESGAWEYGLTVRVAKDKARSVFEKLRDNEDFLFNMLIDVTCVDWLDAQTPRFDVVYQLLSLTHQHRLCVKVGVEEDAPEVDSVLPLWPAANFLEREVWDMYGIQFKGHGDIRRILMYDEFEGHPLRKDYPILKKQPRIPLRIPELRNTAKDMERHQLVEMPTKKAVSQ